MNADVFNAVMPMLFRGLKVTMEIAVIGILLGFILGSLSGYALQSKSKVAKAIAGVYVWIIRGTPIVVQALYVYFVVPAQCCSRYYCYHIKLWSIYFIHSKGRA